jgi:hypothetical protein
MVFLPNPPEDKSLRLPSEIQSLFHWGYAQKIILGISTYMPVIIFFECLDLEQKSSFLDGREIDFRQHDFIRQFNKEIHHAWL